MDDFVNVYFFLMVFHVFSVFCVFVSVVGGMSHANLEVFS